MISSVFVLAETVEEQIKALQDRQTLDSQILTEQFYFWTVVIMWLIHVGFMAYEAGVAQTEEHHVDGDEEHPHDRRRHADLLLLRLVHLRLHGGGVAEGRPRLAPTRSPASAGSPRRGARGWARTSRTTSASSSSSPSSSSPGRPARSCPARSSSASASPPTCSSAVMLGSVVWILDAAWGWSSGGWMTTRFGFHDSIASAVVHGVAGAFTLGVLLNLGPRIGKYDLGRPRPIVQTPQHAHDADGADAHLHRLLRLLRRMPRHPVDGLPRLAQHLPLARRRSARSRW